MPVYPPSSSGSLTGQQLLDLLNDQSDRRLVDASDNQRLSWDGDLRLGIPGDHGSVIYLEHDLQFDGFAGQLYNCRAVSWDGVEPLAIDGQVNWSGHDQYMNYAYLYQVGYLDVNGELQAGNGEVSAYGFRFAYNNGWNFLDTNGNLITNGDDYSGAILQGTSYNSGSFILGNDSSPGDGYIRASNLYLEVDNFGVFGSSASQYSSYGDVSVNVDWGFHSNYPNEAITLEDTAWAVNYCLDTLRAFGFIAY